MPEKPSKKRWDRENTVLMTTKFQRKTDQDVIDYLMDGRNKRNTILKAIRMLMESEREGRSD